MTQNKLLFLYMKARLFLAVLIFIVPVLMIRAVRPFVLIRFGPLRSGRIGHFAVNTELYLCQKDTVRGGPRTFDVFYYSRFISNRQIKRMWDRKLRVSRWARPLDKVNRRLPGARVHAIPMPVDSDEFGHLAHMPPHLSFTPEENRLGRAALEEMGIPDGAPLVCFQARDSGYLDSQFPGRDWTYHRFRDCDIQNFVAAAEELAGRGYYAIRMGSWVSDSLETDHPKVLDYATRNRSDFLDMFLASRCRFYLSADVGFVGVPAIFRRPIAWVNYVPFGAQPVWNPDDLFIPKMLWLRREGRFMTFREIAGTDNGDGLLSEHRSDQYERLGLDVIENAPKEIFDLAVEMDERLAGTWKTTAEDEELQQSYWAIFKSHSSKAGVRSRIGAQFLRQNAALLR